MSVQTEKERPDESPRYSRKWVYLLVVVPSVAHLGTDRRPEGRSGLVVLTGETCIANIGLKLTPGFTRELLD